MAALRRAFLAVVPPEPVLDIVDGLFDRTMRSKLRWTRREHWHVTVQYFGKVADADALIGALAGAVARVPAPTVQLGGGGGFPSARRAAVLWLGVADAVPLRAVHEAVIEAGGPFLRARDLVPYVPHLTLARLDPVKKVADIVDALEGNTFGPAWTAEDIVLVESEPHRAGAVYRTVARLPLA